MNLLILGIIIFFSIHLVPIFPIKNILINRLGENKYKGLFSLIALLGLLIIVYGFSRADFYPIWDPLPYSKEIALVLMPISMILLAAANIQTNIKKIIDAGCGAGMPLIDIKKKGFNIIGYDKAKNILLDNRTHSGNRWTAYSLIKTFENLNEINKKIKNHQST